MKRNKIWAVLFLLGFAAVAFKQAKANEIPPDTHGCVLVASTPTKGTIDCIGDGTVCKVVGDCIKS
ncbi:hypothetical protein [Mucilaginibacter sp. L3T2-6]|uniref:hypothetical protein n=1 Tax=Mucilaginibacter sp. L3T2-6 TaxID=3062491 RepID=UPI0026774D4D|nr:hypothetical protein [Mucilaginibacter sp. L3T2-6]MDO3641300.1 hypothetical protein [Mucilaginibacter sp. L3T2-6]MDV6213940.1 hypothetical protein [Mucilaginibacter sp. L3T2-6]